MSKKKIKNPESNQGKKIKSKPTETGLPNLEHPVFCFKHIQKNFCLLKCEKSEQAALIKQLHRLSQLSWNQIFSAPRHGLGLEKINRNAIKTSIPSSVTEDITFYALRFDGKKPFVGYKNNFIFHILWIDRDFTLYNHG